MKKFLSILICVCVLAFSLVACGSFGEAADESINRFRVVDKICMDDPFCIGDERMVYIVVDRETKVCYLYGPGTHAFMTVLLDAESKPLIWEGN